MTIHGIRVWALALAFLLATPLSGCSSGGELANLGNYVTTFSGFTPLIGKTFTLKLVDTTNGDVLALTTPTPIAADGFSVSFPSVIANAHNYRADFWVDVDSSGSLDHSPNGAPPGVDASWSMLGAGRGGNLAQTFAYNTNFVDITPF